MRSYIVIFIILFNSIFCLSQENKGDIIASEILEPQEISSKLSKLTSSLTSIHLAYIIETDDGENKLGIFLKKIREQVDAVIAGNILVFDIVNYNQNTNHNLFDNFFNNFMLNITEIDRFEYTKVEILPNASKCNYVYKVKLIFDGKIKKNLVEEDINIEEEIFILVNKETKKIENLLSGKYLNENKEKYPQFFKYDSNCDGKEDSEEEINVLKINLAKTKKELDSLLKVNGNHKNTITYLKQNISDLQAKLKEKEEVIDSMTMGGYLRPNGDFDGDGIKNSLDSCPRKKGSWSNNGCPESKWGLNISLGSGGITHPNSKLESEFPESSKISLFNFEENNIPLDLDVTLQYRFNELDGLKHGIFVGVGHNTYSFRYNDSNTLPSDQVSSDFILNTISYPTYISFKGGYFIEFGSDLRKKSNRQMFNIELGYKYRSRSENLFDKETPNFQIDDPNSVFLKFRGYYFYINAEYITNDFISPIILNQNSDFTPLIISVGVELPLEL